MVLRGFLIGATEMQNSIFPRIWSAIHAISIIISVQSPPAFCSKTLPSTNYDVEVYKTSKPTAF